jgi:hypothetical protein
MLLDVSDVMPRGFLNLAASAGPSLAPIPLPLIMPLPAMSTGCEVLAEVVAGRRKTES